MKHLFILVRGAVLAIVLAGTSLRAAVDSPRVASDRWPSLYTIEDFAGDVIRLEGAKTDEEKVLALYKWNHRVMRFGYAYLEGPSPAEIVRSTTLETAEQWKYGVIDPVKLLNVYGEGWCDTRSRLFHALCTGAGLKSETVSVFDPKVRVWYRDNDGQERWHFFDPFRSWYVYTRDRSRIASYEDIVAEPALLASPSKTSIPYSDDPVSNRTMMFMDDGTIYPMRSHSSFKYLPRDYHSMDISLRKGAQLRLNWKPEGKYYDIYEYFDSRLKCTNGPHSHIWGQPGTEHTTFTATGETVTDPESWPWVKNYYLPCGNTNCLFHNRPVKWYGNGHLTYEPDLGRLENFRDGLYSWGSFRNIVAGGSKAGEPRIRPDRPGEEAWLTFRIDTPYVIADAAIEARFLRADPSDVCTMEISADKGDTWREVWKSTQAGAETVAVNIGRQPWTNNQISAVGQYSYLVRIAMKASNPARTGLDRLKITNDLHLNMFTLPMLQPGRNRMRFSAAGREPGDRMRATFCWDDLAGKEQKDVREFSGLKDRWTIRTHAQAPDDITMRYLLLENPGGR